MQLEPSSRSNKLNVSFSWTNANPELLETEVTTKREGAFARIRGLNEIHSTTGNGYGAIELTIDPKENIDAVKLYLSSIIRSVKSYLVIIFILVYLLVLLILRPHLLVFAKFPKEFFHSFVRRTKYLLRRSFHSNITVIHENYMI